MSCIRRLMAVMAIMAMFVLGACGGSGTDKAGDPPSAESKSSAPTSTPDFSVATWNQEWSSARQKYEYALQALTNQMDLLTKSGATDQQFAMVVTTNSRAIADAAGGLVKKLGEASPIPAERADLQTAVDNLRAALINNEKAYRTLANCRGELKCLTAAQPAVREATTRSSSAWRAWRAMPSE